MRYTDGDTRQAMRSSAQPCSQQADESLVMKQIPRWRTIVYPFRWRPAATAVTHTVSAAIARRR
jgi:hypothetical protein